MKRVDVAYVLVIDEETNRVLMVKNRGKEGSYFTLPGGAVEQGETLEGTAIREAKEETGLDVNLQGVVAIAEAFFEDVQHHAVFFTFLAKVSGGQIEITLPDEIEAVAWFDKEEAETYMLNKEILVETRTVPYFLRKTVVRQGEL